MGRIGDIADLVTGLALLGGGYLIYRAVKDAGDIIPSWPTWPELPDWTLPEIPGIGDNGGLGGGGGGVRNGDNGSYLIPEPITPSPPPPEIPRDYLDLIMRGGDAPPYKPPSLSLAPGDLTKGLGRIFQINGGLFGFRKAPGLEFGTRREARRYLKAYGGDAI